MEPGAELVPAPRREGRLRRLLRALRARLRAHPQLRLWYRVGVGVAGATVMVLGLVLVPLPGPGWLIVFAGLAVLASEFRWAARAYGPVRRGVARLQAWWAARKAARTPAVD